MIKNVSKEYAVLVINTREQQGRAADALTESLFQKLRKMLSKKTSSSVSISSAGSESEQTISWRLDIKSLRSVKSCLVEEFFFPPTPGPKANIYLCWAFRTIPRAGMYLWYRMLESRHQTTSIGKKLSTAMKLALETIDVLMQTIFFVYVIPLTALIVIRPIRKIGALASMAFFLALFIMIVIVTWENTMLPLVSWISQLTQQIIALMPDNQLEFGALFPVLAGAIFGAILTAIIVVAPIIRWIFLKFVSDTEGNIRTMGEFSYLLDPLYAAEVRGNFERKIIDLNTSQNVQSICVVCEHTGALLAYEVLSRVCLEKISTPVYLITHKLSLAGFQVSPVRSLWLLVDPLDWERFSKPTPRKLSWYHITNWPIKKYVVRLTARSGDKIPQTQLRSEPRVWFERTNSALTDHIIKLLKLT